MMSYGASREQIRIKWPNDLVTKTEGAKVAGILCEKTGRAVLAGVGVNLKTAPGLDGRLTSKLESLTGITLPLNAPEEFLERLIEELRFEPYLQVLRKQYEELAYFRTGDSIRFEDVMTGESGQGRVKGYGEYGEMILETPEGERRLLSEEVHLKSPT
jgi:biotin-(acetyl-CoA carboxylase) ligase